MKIAMTYGGMLGMAAVIVNLLFYMAGMTRSTITAVAGYAVILGFIIYGCIQYRDRYLGGHISYGKALGTGVMIALFSSLIVALYTYVLTYQIDPGLLEQSRAEAQQKMLESNPNLTDPHLEQGMKIANIFMSPGVIMVMVVIGHVLIGFIFSLITSIFIKKEETGIPSA